MPDQTALQAAVQRIYDAANAYATEVGGVEHGMSVLLGPPIARPDVMVVSIQGAGASPVVQRSWPKALLYASVATDMNPRTGRPNPFGACLRRDFEGQGMGRTLRSSTVASNLVFPQSPSFGEWRKRGALATAWNLRSQTWLAELVGLIEPRVILTYGKDVFETLAGGEKVRGRLGRGTFNGRPVVGCGHPVQGAYLPERSEAMRTVRDLLRS